MEVVVLIVGAGPSGIATAACLNELSIPNVILEKEDCSVSLWKNRTYDRLNLHVAKRFCSLPHMPHPATSPTFISKNDFVTYLDEYIARFNINPLCGRVVTSALHDANDGKWRVEAKNRVSGEVEVYVSKFLVVASGENGEAFVPDVDGLDSFKGEILHSSSYKSGQDYEGKNVLVVGCGNSGMEIAYDLSNFGAFTSIVVRSEFHVLNKHMVHFGMVLLKYLPIYLVDTLSTLFARLEYGNLSKHGIHRPSKGPFYLKATTGRSPVIDVGTIRRIKESLIEVVPAISSIKGNKVKFETGVEKDFDAIVFATGYKSLALNWLKDYNYVLNEDGLPKNAFPYHYKGEKGVYCAGLSQRGLFGVSSDAKLIAEDIKMILDGVTGKPRKPSTRMFN